MTDHDVTALHVCGECGHATDNPRARHGAACPYCGRGELERYVKAGGESAIISTETARVARDELERLIARTGGPDGFEVGQHERLSATPLALVRRELEDKKARAEDTGDHYAADVLDNVLSVVRDVGELTGEETNPDADPLTSATFDARNELARVFGGRVEEGADHNAEDAEAA